MLWFENNADVIVELNTFFDASAQAYGAVAYFVFSSKDYKQNKLKHHWMNKKGKLSEIVDFKEMTVREFFFAENHVFLEAQRESYFYFVSRKSAICCRYDRFY